MTNWYLEFLSHESSRRRKSSLEHSDEITRRTFEHHIRFFCNTAFEFSICLILMMSSSKLTGERSDTRITSAILQVQPNVLSFAICKTRKSISPNSRTQATANRSDETGMLRPLTWRFLGWRPFLVRRWPEQLHESHRNLLRRDMVNEHHQLPFP